MGLNKEQRRIKKEKQLKERIEKFKKISREQAFKGALWVGRKDIKKRWKGKWQKEE